eukprot:TRINITY_DN36666_c0_g1_i1.p1 TRINITY_DN36666_c0_g1~~TRINITY_DN36666_c0_g1_i1.p1  ORF type:complete len:760 (-),score=142.32 TRINITY_DN36666_c0_g1_i1:8-1945(-)
MFEASSGDGYVLVKVALPGTLPAKASRTNVVQPPVVVEQFELEVGSNIAVLKTLVQERTNFPKDRIILLLGPAKRLHEELPMGRVAAAADASGQPLLMHLAASGALSFLRREGQGHREPSGSKVLTLVLPTSVRGARERAMPFELDDSLSDLRWSVQAVSGLPPARMKLSLEGFADLCGEDDAATLGDIGFEDGCTLQVRQASGDIIQNVFDMPFDIPSSGPASSVYERAASTLGLSDPSKLALYAGNELIDRSTDLSQAPIADGVILSAFTSWPVQLSVSVLSSQGQDSSSSDQASSSAEGSTPASVAVKSCDTIAQVRRKLLAACAVTARSDLETQLNGSQAFAIENSIWTTEGSGCNSLAALERLLGHFSPCPDEARLSRLGIADGGCHLVFVPKKQLLLEIHVHNGSEEVGVRQLRVPSLTRLAELSKMLVTNLCQNPIGNSTFSGCTSCRWSLAIPSDETTKAVESMGTGPSYISRVAGVLSKVKRKSFGGSAPASPEKRRKVCLADELDDDQFLGDLHAEHPTAASRNFQKQFQCPISYDIMQDPVVVSGSGNTYDRKSIERHFQLYHRDPINNLELRRPADRKLIPNNQLRSQIQEAQLTQVDLRLSAYLSEQRSFCSGDALYGWCSLLGRSNWDTAI